MKLEDMQRLETGESRKDDDKMDVRSDSKGQKFE